MKKKLWIIGLAVGIVCVLAVLIFLFAGSGNKVNRKSLTDSKQEESKEETDEKDLPILSNDGEEIVIDEEDEKTSSDSDKKDEATASDSKEAEKGSENDSSSTSEQETEQDSGDGAEKEPEENDGPIELPFVPYEK